MAARNQDNSDAKVVVHASFCFNSPTTFAVRKKPAVSSNVGGIWIIQEREGGEKFKLEELALKDSDGNPILTVKPKDTMLDRILNFFPWLHVKKQWNVFLTTEPQPLFTVETSGDYSTIEVSLTDYKIKGSFTERIFTIFDISPGNSLIAAEVKLNNQLDGIEIDSVYNVEVKTGYDQAFIFGLVAVFEQIRPFSNIH